MEVIDDVAVEAHQLVKHFSGKDGESTPYAASTWRSREDRCSAFLGPERRGQVDHRQDADHADDDHLGHGARRRRRRRADPYRARRKIGVALQEAGLDPRQTGRELLVLQGRLFKLSARRAAERARSCSSWSSSRTPPSAA
jgi:ABC-2 type transport system ATP-binding protein